MQKETVSSSKLRKFEILVGNLRKNQPAPERTFERCQPNLPSVATLCVLQRATVAMFNLFQIKKQSNIINKTLSVCLPILLGMSTWMKLLEWKCIPGNCSRYVYLTDCRYFQACLIHNGFHELQVVTQEVMKSKRVLYP